MAVYRETDGDIVREYKLSDDTIFRVKTDHALLEIIPTEEFQYAFFLDNELQFTQRDEYIYHEMLVHPAMSFSVQKQKICVIGGGDGCAVREILKWPQVQSVNVIDWDKHITDLFKEGEWSSLNHGSLQDARVTIENIDIQEKNSQGEIYNTVFVDLTDPEIRFLRNCAELFNPLDTIFWKNILVLANEWITPGGCIVLNLGGITPWNTHPVDWFIETARETSDFVPQLYKVFVPSFGREWCFMLLTKQDTKTLEKLPFPTDFLSQKTWTQAQMDLEDYQGPYSLKNPYKS